MYQCIYCLEWKRAADFNREHVVPESFGGFEGALVLQRAVCKNCNSHFGHTIDLILARGTEEGLQRYLWQVKPAEEIERFRYDALTIIYDGEGDYHGCLLRLQADPTAPNGLRATPIAQVGFALINGGGFRWLDLADVYSGGWKDRSDIDPARGVRIYAPDPEAVRAYLEKEGISLAQWRPMVSPPSSNDEAPVLHISRITADIRRVMAKIALNYLAYVHGASFALRSEFDLVRRFVRYGEEPADPLVHTDGEDAIPPSPHAPEGHRAVIHVVTIEHPLNAEVVIAQVSLFGGLRYQILLSAEPVADLRYAGHIFNLAERRVYELGNRRQAPR